MLEQIILGTIQGIAEWLPVSSEGILVLVEKNILHSGDGIEVIIQKALFLHLGTFLAALVYFRKDVFSLSKAFFRYKSAENNKKKLLKFLIITTLLSGLLGVLLLKGLAGLDKRVSYSTQIYGAQIITLLIGCALLITAFLQIRVSKKGCKKVDQLTDSDGILLGLMQGLAAVPGLSRSGLTVSILLLRRFDDACALKLSFLMSLPIVLGGNIILNLNHLAFSIEQVVGLLFSFVFGLLTINLLLKLAKKINFGYFVLFFGLLVIVLAFI